MIEHDCAQDRAKKRIRQKILGTDEVIIMNGVTTFKKIKVDHCNSARFDNPEIVRYCGVLSYFANCKSHLKRN